MSETRREGFTYLRKYLWKKKEILIWWRIFSTSKSRFYPVLNWNFKNFRIQTSPRVSYLEHVNSPVNTTLNNSRVIYNSFSVNRVEKLLGRLNYIWKGWRTRYTLETNTLCRQGDGVIPHSGGPSHLCTTTSPGSFSTPHSDGKSQGTCRPLRARVTIVIPERAEPSVQFRMSPHSV